MAASFSCKTYDIFAGSHPGDPSLLLFSSALALLRYFMGPFFLDSESL